MTGGAKLVERDSELAALRAALARSATGGAVVLIEGPAGIGKTRLLEALREHVRGFDVLSARGGALESEIAFGLVRQLLEPRLARAPAAERAAMLAGAAAPAADVLGLAEQDRAGIPGDLPGSLHGLFWLVANLAERRPLLIEADDVQWGDRASVEFLVYLARRIEGLPVLLVAAARSGEPGAVDATIGELYAHATVLRPPALSEDGVGELVRWAVGADAPRELVAACHTATGGNPFYLGELLADLAQIEDPKSIAIDKVYATVPSTVTRAILLRLSRLPDPAPRLAAAAALLGEGAALRHAAGLAEIAPAAAGPAADALVRASILSTVHPLRFVHPIVRAAIAADQPPARRAAAHRRAALLLRDDGEPSQRIVVHLLHAAPAGDEWAVRTLHDAAREALATGAPEIAARYLRRALAEPPASNRAGLLGELSAAEFASGAYEASAAAARRAVEAAPDTATRAEIRLTQAYALIAVEGAPAALRCLEQGIAEAGDTNPQLALLLEGELALQSSLADVAHPVLQQLERHRGLPGNTYAERFVLGILALDAVRRQDAAAAHEHAMRALGGGRLLAEGSARTMAYYTAICALLAADALDDAREAIASGAADVLERGLRYGYPGVCWTRGMLAAAEGRLAAAEADMRACAEHSIPTFNGGAIASIAYVLLEQGDVAGAHRELEQGGLYADERPLYMWGPYVRGLVQLAQGKPAAALADLQDVGRHAEEVGGFAAGLPWGAHAALAHLALGDREAAECVVGEELARAQRLGTPRRVGIALRASGLVATGAQRRARLSEAVTVLESSPAVLELAKAQHDLGVALLRAGSRREGRVLLERAHDIARVCGAQGLAQATDDELRIAGARPRRLTFSGVDALTASERRVAELAADGLSNREIAQALFVTPKTVENQLGRAYFKLGLHSRAGLRDALRKPASID